MEFHEKSKPTFVEGILHLAARTVLPTSNLNPEHQNLCLGLALNPETLRQVTRAWIATLSDVNRHVDQRLILDMV